jgi:hypothetical protein
VLHWAGAVHAVPFAWLPEQMPAIEQLPLVHWSDAVQLAPRAPFGWHAPVAQ